MLGGGLIGWAINSNPSSSRLFVSLGKWQTKVAENCVDWDVYAFYDFALDTAGILVFT